MAKILIKNIENGCFLKRLQPKSQNVLTLLISIFIGVSNCSEGSIFFAEKMYFAKEIGFYPKTTIFAIKEVTTDTPGLTQFK